MQIRPSHRLFALLALGASTALAQTAVAPPPWPVMKESPVAVAADPVRPLQMGPLRVTLDGSTLANTRIAIGAGHRQHQGGGTDALDWLCYTLSDSAPAQRIWLTSSELARGRIDGLVAVELPAGSAASAPCPELPAKFRPVRFEDGLWLGSLVPDLRRALEIPLRAGARFSSLFHGQSGNLDMISSTVIEFRGARAVTLHVAHSSQN